MAHTISRRVWLLSAIAVTAAAGVALAQGFGIGPDMAVGSGVPLSTPLRIRVTLSDGQSVDLNRVHVAIDFSNGGHLHVTEQGALPISAPNTAAAANGQPMMPSVREHSPDYDRPTLVPSTTTSNFTPEPGLPGTVGPQGGTGPSPPTDPQPEQPFGERRENP